MDRNLGVKTRITGVRIISRTIDRASKARTTVLGSHKGLGTTREQVRRSKQPR
jgi:hypothetical protein